MALFFVVLTLGAYICTRYLDSSAAVSFILFFAYVFAILVADITRSIQTLYSSPYSHLLFFMNVQIFFNCYLSFIRVSTLFLYLICLKKKLASLTKRM